MGEFNGGKIEFINSNWIDTFSFVVIILGVSIGLLHMLIMLCIGFHKFPVTRILFGHGLCLFVVALCRLCMLLSSQFHNVRGHAFINWCYAWKTGEIWALGMSNTFNAIISLAYLRLMKIAWCGSLRVYSIGKDRVAWYVFVILFLSCTAGTGISISSEGAFLVNKSYCLGVGTTQKRDMLLGIALCICFPSLIAAGFFLAGASYLTLLNHRSKNIKLRHGSFSTMESILVRLENVKVALKYLMISWFCTNFLNIFWLMYYPQSKKSLTDAEYYLVSAQFVTLQNLTDFMVNLNFFILPRLGYHEGIIDWLTRYCVTKRISPRGSASAENHLRFTTATRLTRTTISRESWRSETIPGVELNESLLQTPSDFV